MIELSHSAIICIGDNMEKLKNRYTLGEEIFNAVTHGVGALLSLGGTAVLIVFSVIYSDAWSVVGSSIYGGSLIMLYIMSTLYHAITNEKAKRFFRIMDHTNIFFLIAGTYTPITISILRGVYGWILFGVVWAAAILGIVFNSIDLKKYSKPSVVCYIAMGWVVIFAIKPLLEIMNPFCFMLIVAGGVLYTLGVVFYAIKKVKYFHSVWHIFTVLGSACHYFGILFTIMEM